MTDRRTVLRAWWHETIGARESSAARALAARLNRGDGVEILAERAVFDLARSLRLTTAPAVLVPLVQVLAAVRRDEGGALPRRLGGDPPVLSALRFQRLLRAEGADLAVQIRRALPIVDRACDVGRLGADLLDWTDTTRARWAFAYFDAPLPDRLATQTSPASTGDPDEEDTL